MRTHRVTKGDRRGSDLSELMTRCHGRVTRVGAGNLLASAVTDVKGRIDGPSSVPQMCLSRYTPHSLGEKRWDEPCAILYRDVEALKAERYIHVSL